VKIDREGYFAWSVRFRFTSQSSWVALTTHILGLHLPTTLHQPKFWP